MDGEVLPAILNENGRNVAAQVILGRAVEIVYNLFKIVHITSTLDEGALALVCMNDISDIIHLVEVAVNVDAKDTGVGMNVIIKHEHECFLSRGLVPLTPFAGRYNP